MFLAGAVVASWSLTQGMRGSSPITVMTNVFVTKFSEFSETFRKNSNILYNFSKEKNHTLAWLNQSYGDVSASTYLSLSSMHNTHGLVSHLKLLASFQELYIYIKDIKGGYGKTSQGE